MSHLGTGLSPKKKTRPQVAKIRRSGLLCVLKIAGTVQQAIFMQIIYNNNNNNVSI